VLDVMDLPVARERIDVRTVADAERVRALADWFNTECDGMPANELVVARLWAKARELGVDCAPRLARALRRDERNDEYWAVTVDLGIPVAQPLVWEGDQA
jgi:hypothetical protein